MKLSLGTAQFGSDYGITNTQGVSSEHDVNCVLSMFFEAGNSFLDTAQEYGDAHKKISQWRKKEYLSLSNDINVTTKIYIRNKKDIESFSCNVINICFGLGLKSLYGILVHNPSDLKDKESCQQLNHQFNLLKEQGVVKKTGISVYEPLEILNLYDNLSVTEIDLIQCPVNILDQRFLDPEIQDFCGRNNIEIHGRSLFLQGLLLIKDIPKHLENSEVRLSLKRYKDFLILNNLEPLEACCLFAHQHQDKIDRWVIGFNLPRELQEFLMQINNTDILSEVCFDDFKNKNCYIDPRTWEYARSC